MRFWTSVARDAKQATFSLFALTGMITTSVSVFRWFLQHYGLPIADVFKPLVAAYQRILYPPVEFLLGLMHLHPEDFVKDIAVIYFAIGSAVAATSLSLRKHLATADESYYVTDRAWWLDGVARSPFFIPVWITLSLLLWPVLLAVYCWKPMVVASKHQKQHYLWSMSEFNEKSEKYDRYNNLKANLVSVFAIRLISTVALVCAAIVVNAATV